MDRLEWKVRRIVPETSLASTIFLENTDRHFSAYEAGQFLTLIFMQNGREIRRSYSFSSTPGIDEEICITVKKIPNGEVSRMLLNHLKPGDIIQSLLPAGRFTIQANAAAHRQFFFIAAGSGITPIFSLLKKILREEPRSRCILIYQNQDEDQIIFNQALMLLTEVHARQFKWINLLSRPATRNHRPERLTNFLLEKIVRENQQTDDCLFYLCGPPAFMRMAQFSLKLMEFSDEQIRKENFTVEWIPPAPLIADAGPKKVHLQFRNEQFHFTVNYPANILQAALDNHLALPYSCRGGRCSSCVAKCISGSVRMSINEVLTDQEIRDGWVLTCVGYAETDLELII